MREYYTDKVVVVTGAASGIGLALCEMLLSLNAKAVVMADINADKLNTERARLETAFPGKVLAIRTDVAKQDEVAELIRRAAEFGSGRIDILFNNAGIGLTKVFDETTDADWKFAFDVNFFSALYGIRAVLPIMRAQGGGHIANTASGIVYCPMPQQSMYSATKAALLGMTSALRYELWDDNIRLSTIIPGTVATPMWGGTAPPSAITPEESARGILSGVAANERVVIVTEADRNGAVMSTKPDATQEWDEYFLSVARRRKSGETSAL